MARRQKNYRRFKKGVKKIKHQAKTGAFGKVGQVAYKAFKIARRVMDVVNTEYHNVTLSSSAAAVSYSGGYSSLLTTISQGVQNYQRIGDSIKIQNITMRCFASRNGADAVVRYILVWDPQNKVTDYSDVMDYKNSPLAIIGPKNYDKRFQTRVLLDKCLVVTEGNATIQMQDHVIPINEHTQFDETTTTINSGDLKLLVISNLTGANLPTFSYVARVTFTDN